MNRPRSACGICPSKGPSRAGGAGFAASAESRLMNNRPCRFGDVENRNE